MTVDSIFDLDNVDHIKVAAYMCPSESIKQGPSPGVSSFMSYAANYGGPASMTAWNGMIVPMNGTPTTSCQCFAGPTSYSHTNFAPFGIEGVTDGTSNTAVFSEKLIGIQVPINSDAGIINPGSIFGKRVIFNAGAKMTPDSLNGKQAQQYFQACRAIPGTALEVGTNYWNGACWSGSHGGTLRFSAYNYINTPNGLTCTFNATEDPGQLLTAITAASNHSGGVNVCFGDGSVKFIKDSISVQIWWGLGSRNLGEVLSSDAY